MQIYESSSFFIQRVWFIVARKPDKPVFGNYIRSRRIMGAALLVLSANYAVHLLLHPRFTAPDAAILMNLSTYYISAWLFSSALTSLLDNHYIARRKFILHIISWLSVFTWWAVIYGIGCGLFTFIPGKYVFIWILSSIPFYIYLFCSYMNYMLFYERVETALETDMPESSRQNQPAYYAELEKRLAGWIGRNGFTHPGLTIEDLAGILCTNRTYIAAYIKSVYHVTFREWIAGLRIEYAKRLMSEHPEMTVSAVSEASGFLSLSYFSRIFTEKEGITPAKWK